MAQSFVTDAGVLIIPGSYATVKVEASNSGLATTGVLFLVGEADAGPDFSLEDELALNLYGPDQVAEVVAKYKSGPVVDAFRAATAPASDENIQGSFSRAFIIKTNKSNKASATMLGWDSTEWSKVQDKSWGKLGNLLARKVTAETNEAVPTTDAWTYLPAISSTNIELRANGGSALSYTIAAQLSPTAFVAAIDALAGVSATGGVDRALCPAVGNLSMTVISGNTVTIDCSVPFLATAQPGDTLWIKAASSLAVANAANGGSYIVISATSTSITCRKLLDLTGAPNALTAPVGTVGSVSIVDANDVLVYSPVTISVTAANPTDGLGKTLEVAELTTGVGLLSYVAWTLVSGVPVVPTWISKTSTPVVITSATEYSAKLEITRQLDAVSEEIIAGGQVVLTIGYKGTTATAVINDGEMTITVTGGSGTSLGTIKLSDHPTINDLAGFISSNPGYTCAAASAVIGQQPSTSLDEGTFNFASTHGAKTGRIKQDSYKFQQAVVAGSAFVELDDVRAKGLPAPQAVTYLTGGTKGGTSDADYQAALDAMELLRGNFVVPCFSRDATEDKADGLTELASTYTIDFIHAYAKSHVLKMSTLKKRRNRQAFLSTRAGFNTQRAKASNIAHFRCSMTFQDDRAAVSGAVKQYHPWMYAVKAAATQAAGFYRAIVHKYINTNGAVHAAKDFTPENDAHVENALLSGLLPVAKDEAGGWYWVSDQTTYGKDANFVYNSIQATYVADIIALSTAQRMERLFVGQSVADVSASLALTALESIMADFFRLKLIAKSDDAPRGFRNAKVQIVGPSMVVQIEVKLAGAIYFIPISFLVTPVQQSASG